MRKRQPFARIELRRGTSSWYAKARGMSSGPWETEDQAQKVVDAWNEATTLDVASHG